MAKRKFIIRMEQNTLALYCMVKEMDKAYINLTISLIMGSGRIIGSMAKESTTTNQLNNNIVDYFKKIRCMEKGY